jgi:hypothetical protein
MYAARVMGFDFESRCALVSDTDLKFANLDNMTERERRKADRLSATICGLSTKATRKLAGELHTRESLMMGDGIEALVGNMVHRIKLTV